MPASLEHTRGTGLPHWWRSEEGLAGFTGEGGGHPPVAQSTVLSFGLADACLLRIYNSQKKSLGGYTLPGPPRVSRLFCTMDLEIEPANYIAGTPYLGAEARFTAGPGGYRGALTAWDVQAASVRWQIKEKFPVWSGAAVTAGDVVFYGTMDGFLKAVNALSGEVLWQFKTESGIVGQPTTYRGPDGRQYVAILSGVGGWAGRLVSGDLDARDATAAFGFANAMGDLKDATKAGGTLYVFRLP